MADREASSTSTPSSKSVADVLEGLLDRDITVGAGDPVIPRPTSPAAIAIYTNRNLRMQAVVVLDLPLAASVGSALALLPVETATTAVKEKVLPQPVVENLNEVLNVMTSVFNVAGAQHLSLYQVVAPGDAVPTDVAVLARTLGRRLDLAIGVKGYESGQLSVVCV